MKKTGGKNLYHIKGALWSILDNLVVIFTLGYYWTNFHYKFIIKNS